MAYTENEIMNLVSGSDVTGQSTYDLWKSLGYEGDAQDFLAYLKDDGDASVDEETLAQIEQNKNDISRLSEEIDNLSVEDYVKTEAERVAKQVQNRQHVNTFTMPCISDIHWSTTYTYTQYAVTHAGQAMAIIGNLIPIDLILDLGDYTVASSTTPLETHRAEIMGATKALSEAVKGKKKLTSVGNHDCQPHNYDGFMTAEQIYGVMGKYNSINGAVVPTVEKERSYCYMDFEAERVRVIVMNTADTKGINIKSHGSFYANRVSAEQLKWLVNEALDFSEKTDATKWKIIICGHHPFDWTYNNYTTESTYTDLDGNVWSLDTYNVVTILKAYKDSSSGSITLDGVTVNYDFSTIDKARVICQVHGHLHNYKTGVLQGTDIPRICIPNACHNRNNEYASNANANVVEMFGEDTTYDKTVGTVDDTTFSVLTFDFDEEVVYVDNYGVGYDRIVSFAGNTTEAEPTNQIPLSVTSDGSEFVGTNGEDGYKLGYRISTSSGNESASSVTGIAVTGYIEVPTGATIRIKNIDISDNASTYGIYGTLTTGISYSGYCNELFTEESDGVYVATLPNTTDSYFRMSGVITADSILTVNEALS